MFARLKILVVFLFFLNFLPCKINGQYFKHWELYLDSNLSGQTSFNINDRTITKTIQMTNGTFITLLRMGHEDYDNHDRIVVINFDESGNILWLHNSHNGTENNDLPYDILTDNDNNIIVCGQRFNTVPSKQLMYKLNVNGEVIWLKEMMVSGSQNNACKALVFNDNSSFFSFGDLTINGKRYSTIQKIDFDGNELWKKTLNDKFAKKMELIDNELICITGSNANNLNTFYKVDLEGIKLDSFDHDNITNRNPKFDQTQNSYVFSFGNFEIEKRSNSGEISWTYTKASNLPDNVTAEELNDCEFDSAGNIYVTGRHYGEHYGDSLLYSNCDILTTKLDYNGNVLWENIYKYDHTPLSCQIGKSITVDDNGNIFVIGHQSVKKDDDVFHSYDQVVLVYNQAGLITDSLYFNSKYNSEEFGLNIEIFNDDIYAFGYTDNDIGTTDYTIVKYSRDPVSKTEQIVNDAMTVFPNPGIDQISFSQKSKIIDIEIINTFGQVILQQKKFNTNESLNLPDELITGVYFVNYLEGQKGYTIPLFIKP